MSDLATPETHGPYDAHHAPPPLDFDAWMDVSVTLLQRTPDEVDDILDRRELEPEQWQAIDVFWLGELAKQVARQNFKLAARYGERCAAELRRRPPPSDAPPPPDMDATAFMTALPDETVVPFESPLAVPTANELLAAGPTSGAHPDTGKTQEVAALDVPDDTLPFDDDR